MCPTARVVIVTFNNQADIVECVESVEAQKFVDVQILVVDNASSDSTVELIRRQFPGVEIQQNANNEGFASACNVGLKAPIPEYVAFVNPDTQCDSLWLKCAIDDLQSSDSSGASQARLMLYDNRTHLNSRGNVANFLFFAWPEGYNECAIREENPRQIPFGSGGAVVFERRCLEETSGFDEIFFMYGEDTDLGIRAFLRGYDTLYSPRSMVYHKYRFRESGAKYFLLERNRVMILLKIYRVRTIFLVFPAFLVAELGVIAKAISEGWLLSKIASYGFVVKNLPQLVEKRAAVQKSRVRSDAALISILRGGIDFSALSERRIFNLGNRFLDKYWRFLLKLRI